MCEGGHRHLFAHTGLHALMTTCPLCSLPHIWCVGFFTQNIKKKFPLVLNRVNQLVDRIHAQGPAASIDVDQAALRVTLDVIGLVSVCLWCRCCSEPPEPYREILLVWEGSVDGLHWCGTSGWEWVTKVCAAAGCSGSPARAVGGHGAGNNPAPVAAPAAAHDAPSPATLPCTHADPPPLPHPAPPILEPQAGFKHDYNSVSQDIPPYDHLLRVLPRCFTEVMLRVANPLRPLFPTFFRYGPKGTAAFAAFQQEMNALLKNLEARGEVEADDTDIGTQLLRVMREHQGISRDRVLSEIGILFVEGFETTGG